MLCVIGVFGPSVEPQLDPDPAVSHEQTPVPLDCGLGAPGKHLLSQL